MALCFILIYIWIRRGGGVPSFPRNGKIRKEKADETLEADRRPSNHFASRPPIADHNFIDSAPAGEAPGAANRSSIDLFSEKGKE